MSVSVAVSSLKPQTGFCNKCKKQRAERKTLLKIEGKESWIWFLRNDKIKTMPLKKKKSYFHCRPFFLNISAQLRWLEKLSITHANRDWYGVWWLHELRMDEKYQPPPEGWAASIAVLRSLQSHLQQCANTSRTTDSTGWLPATFCQQCLKSSIQNGKTPRSLPCAGWPHSHRHPADGVGGGAGEQGRRIWDGHQVRYWRFWVTGFCN